MIVYPLLNFVLPLILSTFILVDSPSRCSECQNKTVHKVAGNGAIESIPHINIDSGESSVVKAGKDAKSKTHTNTD